MASLNLVPNPSVLLVQSGIFVTALFCIKKLFITPYLTVRQKRLSVTVGAQSGADKLNSDAQKIQDEIEQKMSEAMDTSRKIISDSKQQSSNEKSSLIEEARKSSADVIGQMRQQIAKDLKDERAKVPSVVSQLTDAVFNKAMQ